MIEVSKPIQLMVDNKSTIDLAKNLVSHGRNKHIEIRFNFLIDQVNKGKLELICYPIEVQTTDILTKPMRTNRFEQLRSKIRVVSFKYLN